VQSEFSHGSNVPNREVRTPHCDRAIDRNFDDISDILSTVQEITTSLKRITESVLDLEVAVKAARRSSCLHEFQPDRLHSVCTRCGKKINAAVDFQRKCEH